MTVDSLDNVFAAFQGALNNVTIIVTGFNLPVFSWNCNWRYFDSKFEFVDMGSVCLGSPASLSGSITPMGYYCKPKVNMMLSIPSVKIGELIAKLALGFALCLWHSCDRRNRQSYCSF